MASLPKSYTIVRKGQPCEVTVQDSEDLIRLRSELDLVCRCKAGTSAEVSAALGQRAGQLGDDQIRELQQILDDAHHPVNSATLAEMDADFPELHKELQMAVIEDESQRIREDITRAAAQDQADAPAAHQAQAEAPAGAAAADGEDEPGGSDLDAELVVIEGVLPQGDADQSVEVALEQVEDTVDELAAQVDPSPEDATTADRKPAEADSGWVTAEEEESTEAAAISDHAGRAVEQEAASLINEAVSGEEGTGTGVEFVSEAPATVVELPSETSAADALDEIERGFQDLGRLFTAQAHHIWREAKQTLAEARQFAEQTREIHQQVQAALDDIRARRDEANQAAQETHALRREALNSRNGAQQALERATARATEAENAADRALREANQAQAYNEKVSQTAS